MKYLYSLFFSILSIISCAQFSMDLHAGALAGKFNYPDYVKFGESYNAFYANDPDLITPIEMQTFATGYQVGTMFNFNSSFNGAIDFSRIKTGVSRAEWATGFNRGFQIKSYLFDMDAGFYVIPEEYAVRLSIGLGLTLQSTQILSFLEYDDTRSYGNETRLNGVWTSWRGNTPLVLKLSYMDPTGNWKFFLNTKFPLQKKKVGSAGYAYSSGFTSAGDVFPADFSLPWGIENSLSEDFRFIHAVLGVAYQFNFN